jgi:purine-binding chemotaxis protein CheW
MEANTSTNLRQFVTFKLDQEEYGIDIQNVSIIEKMMPITRVPKTPQFIRGVINLRGEIVPVMDLKLRFDIEQSEATDDTRIIIVKVEEVLFGIIVDAVSEVIQLKDDAIESTASLKENTNIDFIYGIGKVDERIVILLNLERLSKIDQ